MGRQRISGPAVDAGAGVSQGAFVVCEIGALAETECWRRGRTGGWPGFTPANSRFRPGNRRESQPGEFWSSGPGGAVALQHEGILAGAPGQLESLDVAP